MSTSEQIDFYWRPGCGFCMFLERRLNKADVPFRKLNIWDDPEHAAFVRSVANGNETVPTLRIGGQALVNPSLGDVLDTMRAETPELLPAD